MGKKQYMYYDIWGVIGRYIPRERFLDPPPPRRGGPPINFVHGSDSVLTNLIRGRSARPPSLS